MAKIFFTYSNVENSGQKVVWETVTLAAVCEEVCLERGD